MTGKKRIIRMPLILGLVLTAALLLSSCAGRPDAPAQPTLEPASPVSLTDGLGNPVQLPAPAQQIISLSPGNTEILFAIGAGSQVVGRDTFSDYPAEAKAIPDIGGGFSDLNTEVIVSLKPDLVLASMLTPPEQIKALQDLGLTVFTVANPTDYPGMFESLRTVALLTGHSAQAEQLILELDQRVKKIKDKTSQVSERPLVFYELDGTDPNAPWTPGPGSFVGMIIELAGGENLGAGLDNEWVQISIEELISQDPEIILIGDATWGGVTLEDVKARSGWDALTAIQSGRMFIFDDNLVSRPGPRMVGGLEAMAKLLHPELFE